MHLLGVRENDGWLESAWEFTYRVGWAHIQTAVYEVYDAFEKPEVLVRGEHVDIDNKEEIKELEEELNMSIRGYCPLIKNRLMIIFHNQVKTVTVVMSTDDGEYKEADYEKFNHSMCEFMSSIEINMFENVY